MKTINYRYLSLLSVFALISILIWTVTPYWFVDLLIYTNDFLIFGLVIFNACLVWKTDLKIAKTLIAIHVLAVIELLMVFQSGLDCTGSTSIRVEYFLWHYARLRIDGHGIDPAWLGFSLVSLTWISMIYLEYKIIKSVLWR
jgi:hypothetical protein